MRQKVYLHRLDDIYIAYSEEPITTYSGGSIHVKVYGDGSLGGMSIPFKKREEAVVLTDAIVAYAGVSIKDEFLEALERVGFKNQNEEPFHTEWELERTLEKAERLKKRLKGVS